MSKKIVELFGGIGAATTAIKRLGIEYQLVDYVELDKHAVKAFNLLNNTNFKPTDIKDIDVNKYGEIDLLIAGWPCQDLSIAGKQAGLDKGNRSGLIWTTINKVHQMKEKPKVILLENVKGLLNKKHQQDFEVIKGAFKALGYHWSHKLLNAKYYGVPQNRERVYCVLKRDKTFTWNWANKFNKVNVKTRQLLDEDALWDDATDNFVMLGKYGYINATDKDLKLKSSYKRHWDANDKYIGAITASTPTKLFSIQYYQVLHRQLNAKECWRFMAFNDQDYDKVKEHISEHQLRKQAGNSIVVNVLVEIFRELYNG